MIPRNVAFLLALAPAGIVACGASESDGRHPSDGGGTGAAVGSGGTGAAGSGGTGVSGSGGTGAASGGASGSGGQTADAGPDADSAVGGASGADGSTDAVADSPMDAVADASSACALPITGALSIPGSVSGTNAGASGNPSVVCSPGTPGPESVYTLSVSKKTGVIIDVVPDIDTLVLAIRSACADPKTAIACADEITQLSTGKQLSQRVVLDPGLYYVLVDSLNAQPGASFNFTLSTQSYQPAVNAACDSASTLTTAGLKSQSTKGSGAFSMACGGLRGGQLFYSLSIPPKTKATVTAQPTGAPAWWAELRILDSCLANSCLAYKASAGGGKSATVVLDNPSGSPKQVLVTVSDTAEPSARTFDLDLSLAPL